MNYVYCDQFSLPQTFLPVFPGLIRIPHSQNPILEGPRLNPFSPGHLARRWKERRSSALYRAGCLIAHNTPYSRCGCPACRAPSSRAGSAFLGMLFVFIILHSRKVSRAALGHGYPCGCESYVLSQIVNSWWAGPGLESGCPSVLSCTETAGQCEGTLETTLF